VLRDLVGAADRTVDRERRKVARDGWGGRLLARQDPEGTWAESISFWAAVGGELVKVVGR
jgi:hypothetical protein